MSRDVRTVDDVLVLLDGLFDEAADRWTDRAGGWWDAFYADRDRPVPFFGAGPDENLVSYVDSGDVPVRPGTRVLDIGCGAGRNAVWLAGRGAHVDAVDLSEEALGWARETARAAGVEVSFLRGDVFGLDLPDGGYDLVYDSGCFHHLPPHRRVSYLDLLDRVLRPGGAFALTCFTGDMGCTVPDGELYRAGRLDGGLAYTDDELRSLFADLSEVQLRRMQDRPDGDRTFGRSFLWSGLFRRPAGPSAEGAR